MLFGLSLVRGGMEIPKAEISQSDEDVMVLFVLSLVGDRIKFQRQSLFFRFSPFKN